MKAHTTWIRTIGPYLFSICLVVIIFLLAISLGSVHIPVRTVFLTIVQEGARLPLGVELTDSHTQIIMQIRLPRVLLAFLVGASLGIAGAAFQGLLRNPLADPFTIGVSSGSALGAVTVIFFQLSFIGIWTLPVVAIVSGFVTLCLVLSFTRLVQRSLATETIILTGIIASSFLGACLSLMVALSQEELRHIIHWLMGSVGMRGWSYVYLISPFLALGFILVWFCRNELNALMYGEMSAHYLGVAVKKKKFVILLAATLLTGSAVAVSGTIGFVGLVIPHMVRLLWGSNHQHVLPLAGITGGGFLILADLTARTIVAPAELPIGVITALVGSPIFAWMLYRQNKRKQGA
ncbi:MULTISPECIES: FecCD family ABC transporter permease [Shouchella]|uniref:ABC transporter permease protein n=3 Tax=Bacillaceae TaxID=186817 RepID=A0A060LWU3_9BACI|nr:MULTISPECIES: iron ABC transporter permease [Shouchella]AIC94657.1 ABC transporter permease protein [Shouchella lehensis G1]KQL51793.1 ABC transporter permease [Alkalicoccobacillus plakortidis]MBG9784462.1 corrinoid ABC transporter permease [Shouchella lehensis]TES50533.1 iron ABC transporter permease [Shouchella lehensis]